MADLETGSLCCNGPRTGQKSSWAWPQPEHFGIVIIPNRVTAFIIRIRAVKLVRSKAWTDNQVAAHALSSTSEVHQDVQAAYF